MIHYLCKKHGFRVVGLEGVNYFDSYVSNRFKLSHALPQWKIESLWLPIWSKEIECKGLLDLINKGDITFFGIDNNVLLEIPTTINGIKMIVDQYDNNKEIKLDWNLLNQQYYQICNVFYRKHSRLSISTQDELSFLGKLHTIKNWVNKLLIIYPHNQDLEFLLIAIDNIKSYFRQDHITRTTDLFNNPFMLAFANNERDQHMANNVIHYLDHHPKEKIVIWCANGHGALDISQTQSAADSLMFARTKFMGEILFGKYRDQLYSIVFSSYRDEQCGLLEQELTDYPFGFIDFSSIRYNDSFFNKPFEANVLYPKRVANWLYIWDGYYYIRNRHYDTK